MTGPMLEIRNLTSSSRSATPLAARPAKCAPSTTSRSPSRSGAVYGLAGESGSGKSTIARMIMGLEQADSGDILHRWPNRSPAVGTRATAARCRWCSRTPARRSIRAAPSASRSPCRWTRTASAHRQRRIAELLEMVQLPANFARALSARALRRPEAARRDRPGAGRRAEAGGAGRADFGARCVGAGARDGPARRSRPAARPDLSLSSRTTSA
jgi:ABC-type glutathione transport system ATPase component